MPLLKIKKLSFSRDLSELKEFEVESLDIECAKSVSFVVQWQLARRRSGSAKTKTMSEISGTTAKPYKQKGTGRARQGSKRSVQFVGGRTCHGPTPRSFDFAMPKKIASAALSSAIRLKLNENKFLLISDFCQNIRTSNVSNLLNKNSVTSALIVHDGSNLDLVKSARNIKNVKTIIVDALNTYDMMKYDHIIVDEKLFEPKILGVI
jgi:large subunit ribosomal protein L4